MTIEREETINTYSKFSRKTQKRLGTTEKIKRLENGEEVKDEISNSYYENDLTTGQDGEKGKEDGYDKKIKKKRKKQKKGTESIIEENGENNEDIKEKRW